MKLTAFEIEVHSVITEAHTSYKGGTSGRDLSSSLLWRSELLLSLLDSEIPITDQHLEDNLFRISY